MQVAILIALTGRMRSARSRMTFGTTGSFADAGGLKSESAPAQTATPAGTREERDTPSCVRLPSGDGTQRHRQRNEMQHRDEERVARLGRPADVNEPGVELLRKDVDHTFQGLIVERAEHVIESSHGGACNTIRAKARRDLLILTQLAVPAPRHIQQRHQPIQAQPRKACDESLPRKASTFNG